VAVSYTFFEFLARFSYNATIVIANEVKQSRF
jgi:hypothetical protein